MTTSKTTLAVGIHFTIPKEMTREQVVKQYLEEEVTITMPCCDQIFTYSQKDVPLIDTPCPCGAEGRFIVKFKDEKND